MWGLCPAPLAWCSSAAAFGGAVQPADSLHCLPPPLPAAFWGLLFLNSFLAYFVNLTNFLVTKHTSALTLQVCGTGSVVVTGCNPRIL